MELSDLKGVGGATEDRLRSAGVQEVDELAQASVDRLTEEGLSDSKAQRLIDRAKREAVVIQSGTEAAEEAEAKDYVPSGMEALDELLGGGYREAHIAGISGESSSGKTQVAFRALGAAIEEYGGPAIYIETERERFNLDRIVELSDLDRDEVAPNVHRIKAYDLDQQRASYEKVAEHFDDVSIVVVDSFTARFRLNEAFEGRTTLSDRNAEMVKHLNGIETMVEHLDCPVILTLQIQGNPSAYGSSTATWGGTLMEHTLTYTLKMSQAQGSFRKATLAGHPSQSEGEVLVTIADDGLAASKEG